MKLTKAMRVALQFILANGPGVIPLTKAGRTTAAVARLVAGGFLEPLNRIRPGPPMYEITRAGRAALAVMGAHKTAGRYYCVRHLPPTNGARCAGSCGVYEGANHRPDCAFVRDRLAPTQPAALNPLPQGQGEPRAEGS